jgi:HK97 family phage prohead protease
VPDTQAGRDVLALAERNDLGGMSFGFTAKDDHVTGNSRELRIVDLYEIRVVAAFPAYADTVVQARAQSIQMPNQTYAARTLKILELLK